MSADQQTLEILLRAKADVDVAFSQLRSAMKEAEHSTEEFSQAATGHMEAFHHSLDVGKEHLQEHQKELASNTGALGQMLSALGPVGLAAAAVSGAVAESTLHFAHYSHELQVLKAETGFTIEGLQGIKFAADASGTSVEKISAMATKLDAAIEKGSPGIAKLGLDFTELKNSSPEDAFREVSAALVEIPNEIERVAVAREVFGRSGAAALEFAENMNHLSRVADEAGIVMSEKDVKAAADLAGGYKELADFAEGLSNQFAAGLIAGTDFKGTIESLAPAVRLLGEGMRIAGESASFALNYLNPLGIAYHGVAAGIDAVVAAHNKLTGGDNGEPDTAFTRYETGMKGSAAQVKALLGQGQPAEEDGQLFDIDSYDKDIKKNEELAAAVEKAKEKIKERKNEEKEAAREAKEESREREAWIKAEEAAQEKANHAFEAAGKSLDKLRSDGITKYNEALGENVSALEKQEAAIEGVYQATLDKADADLEAQQDAYALGTISKEQLEHYKDEADAIKNTAAATRDLNIEDAKRKDLQKSIEDANKGEEARLKAKYELDVKNLKLQIDAAHQMEELGHAITSGVGILESFGLSAHNAFAELGTGIGAGIAAAGQLHAALKQIELDQKEGKSTTAAYAQAALAAGSSAAGIYQRGSVVGGAATGLSMGLELGKGNPLIAAGGAVVGAALGFFGGKNNDKKAIQELTNQIKQEFVGGVDEAKQHARELGLDLDKAFDSKKPKDVQSAMDQLNHAMADQKNRMDGLGEAASGLAQRTTGFIHELEGNFSMVDAQGNKTSVTLEEVAKHTEDWKKGIASARNETLLMNAASAEQEKEFDRLGLYAAATFGGMVKETGDVVGALRSLDPILSDLSMAETEMGFAGSETLNTLLHWHDLLGVNKGLGDSIQGLNSMIDGLGKAGIHTQQLFQAFGGDAVSIFDQITAGGATSNDALGIMQPTLQKLWEQEHDFGYAADEATQHLIDQGVQQGLVGDKMRDVNERILKTLQHIDDAIRGIPDKTATVTLKTKYTTEGTPPSGSPWKGGSAVDPGNNDGPTYHDDPDGDGNHYYASGGRVPWRPGGRPAVVSEYQTENILSDNQLADVIRRGAAMIPAGADGQGSGAPFVIHNYTVLDGQVVDEKIIRTTADAMRSGRL